MIRKNATYQEKKWWKLTIETKTSQAWSTLQS